MARTVIPTNFQDDELAEEMQGRRRYRQILNLDGTVSFEDETDYDTEGSTFGASRVNEMAQNINESADVNKIIDDLEDIAVVTQNGFMAGALAVKELNSNLTANSQPFRFGYQDGKYGFIISEGGADTFSPFSSIDNFENITNKFTWHSNQRFGFYSSEDMSDYRLIVTAQLIQPKNANYDTIQGCECMFQKELQIGVGAPPYVYAQAHIALWYNITGVINVSGGGIGTGNHAYVAYGLK